MKSGDVSDYGFIADAALAEREASKTPVAWRSEVEVASVDLSGRGATKMDRAELTERAERMHQDILKSEALEVSPADLQAAEQRVLAEAIAIAVGIGGALRLERSHARSLR
jgi:hypothetical protein